MEFPCIRYISLDLLECASGSLYLRICSSYELHISQMPATNQDLLRLRALVGFLGEADHFDWWNTSFLGKTGLQFLSRPFPRSTLNAALHSVTITARHLHDESIGKGEVAHLFRLPHIKERQLAEVLRRQDAPLLSNIIRDQPTALEALESMAGARTARTGAVRVGEPADVYTPDGIRNMAGYYYEAFTNGHRTFPYFSI